MSVDKVILRAILSTLMAIGMLFAFAFVTLVAAFPSTTMELAYDLGMNSSSIRNAERAYRRSDDIYFMAYAVNVAISEDNYEKTVSCGEKLISDEEFQGFCMEKNALGEALDYEQYIYGKVCVAHYENGEKEKAVQSAFAYTTQNFPQNNAVVAVVYAARKKNDADTANMIKGKMEQVQKERLSETDKAYYEYVLGLLSE